MNHVKIRQDRQVQRARWSVSAFFFTNGALFANLVPRYPEIKDALDLSNLSYGLAVAAFPVGALVFGMAAGWLVRSYGSARIAAVATVATAVSLYLAGTAHLSYAFSGFLFLAGASDAIADVAQNAHGLRVQKLYRRSIINAFHAFWSAGLVVGGLMSALAITTETSRQIHLGFSAVLFSGVAIYASLNCLPGKEAEAQAGQDALVQDGSAPSLAQSRPRRLLLVGIIAVGTLACLVEDLGSSWAALFMSEEIRVASGIAALGFVSLGLFQFAGRAIGDRYVDRFGAAVVTRVGGALVFLGMVLVLVIPVIGFALLGFAAVGLGVATLGPIAMNAADDFPGLKSGTGLTIASWVMRLGFLLSPPLVGAIADAAGLRVALIVFLLAGVAVIFVSKAIPTGSAKS